MRRKGRREDHVFSDMVDADASFLPDEATASAHADAVDVRDRVGKLEEQLHAQFSAMAAYATIAQQQTDAVRAEARHDLDRSQSTMIGLIERVRRECNDSIAGVEVRLGGGPQGDRTRMSAIEDRLASLEGLLATSLASQQQLLETVQVLVEERMQREGWLVSSGSTDDLSLR